MVKFKLAIAIILILLITFIAFFPSLKNGFTNWDDDRYVTDNSVIRSISLPNLQAIFTTYFIGHYQPVTILSFLFEYRFFKLNPFGYHLTNLILHLLNCLLVFWLIFILTGNLSVSWVTAAFFGIHPLQVESVAWITERKNLLYALFFLASIISYLYYIRNGLRLKYLFLSLVLFIISLLSKSMAVTLPLVLLAVDYFLRRKTDKIMFIEKIPYFILSLIFGIIAILGVYSSGATSNQGIQFNLLHRLMVAFYGIIFYLSKIVLPIKLSCFYPYYGIRNIHIHPFCIILLFVFLVGTILSGKYSRKVVFGSGFFIICILPALQLIPNGSIITADRYAYVPSIGIFYIAGSFFNWVCNKYPQRFLFKAILTACLITVLTIFSFLTWKRCAFWKNSIVLWEDSINNNPFSPVAYYNLGNAYSDAGNYDKAIMMYRKAIAINGNLSDAYNNLCYACKLSGKYQEGIESCKKAIQISPDSWKSYYNLGEIYDAMKQREEAIKTYLRAIEIDGAYLEAYNNLAAIYAENGDIGKAMEVWNKIVKIDPKFAAAHFNLAVFYYKQAQYDLAVKHCDSVIALGGEVDPKFLELLRTHRK